MVLAAAGRENSGMEQTFVLYIYSTSSPERASNDIVTVVLSCCL